MKRGLVLAAAVAVCVTAACGGKNPAAPTASDVTGAWTGTSTYPNAPFQLSLTQTGSTLRGEYKDGHDRSLAVTGTFTAPALAIVIDFGDAKLNLQGTVQDARTAHGVMFTSALGNRQYPFTMTR